jgi:hypothetical protein
MHSMHDCNKLWGMCDSMRSSNMGLMQFPLVLVAAFGGHPCPCPQWAADHHQVHAHTTHMTATQVRTAQQKYPDTIAACPVMSPSH